MVYDKPYILLSNYLEHPNRTTKQRPTFTLQAELFRIVWKMNIDQIWKKSGGFVIFILF